MDIGHFAEHQFKRKNQFSRENRLLQGRQLNASFQHHQGQLEPGWANRAVKALPPAGEVFGALEIEQGGWCASGGERNRLAPSL